MVGKDFNCVPSEYTRLFTLSVETPVPPFDKGTTLDNADGLRLVSCAPSPMKIPRNASALASPTTCKLYRGLVNPIPTLLFNCTCVSVPAIGSSVHPPAELFSISKRRQAVPLYPSNTDPSKRIAPAFEIVVFRTKIAPFTSNSCKGTVVPTPTLPSFRITKRSTPPTLATIFPEKFKSVSASNVTSLVLTTGPPLEFPREKALLKEDPSSKRSCPRTRTLPETSKTCVGKDVPTPTRPKAGLTNSVCEPTTRPALLFSVVTKGPKPVTPDNVPVTKDAGIAPSIALPLTRKATLDTSLRTDKGTYRIGIPTRPETPCI